MPGNSRWGGQPWAWIRRHDQLTGVAVATGAVGGTWAATGNLSPLGGALYGIASLTAWGIRRRDPARALGATPTAPTPPHTERLHLRWLRMDDLDRLDALNHDADVLRFVAAAPPTRDELKLELGSVLSDYGRHPGFGRFAAETPQGTFVGWLELRVGQDQQRPELDARLRRKFWGTGLATEGAIALVDRAFRLGALTVVCETFVAHLAARRVLEHCGMQPVIHFPAEGSPRVPGMEQGMVRYEIAQAEWMTRQPRPS